MKIDTDYASKRQTTEDEYEKVAGKVPHVVIIGAEFGGLEATKGLLNAPIKVTVIDRMNYHLFQPMLYQVATAGLSPEDIAAPIRGILNRQHNTEVLMDEVIDVDVQARVSQM